MDTTTDRGKQRTITLTDERPVRIYEDEWPVIARASDDSYGSLDPARHAQALQRDEVDRWYIRVREHADGRRIVYGVLDAATSYTGTRNAAGGYLLTTGPAETTHDTRDEATIDAIRRVAREIGRPELAADAIADLPAEDL